MSVTDKIIIVSTVILLLSNFLFFYLIGLGIDEVLVNTNLHQRIRVYPSEVNGFIEVPNMQSAFKVLEELGSEKNN